MKKFIGLFALLAVLSAFLIAPEAPVTIAPEGEGLKVGDKAPDFKLKNVDGKFYSLSQFQNQVKGFIVVFTCNTCPYAVMYESRLKELHGRWADNGYPVVAINPNDPDVKPGDSFAKMQSRWDEKSMPYLYLFDEGQKVYPQYGATRTPQIYLLDNEMTVQYIGSLDDNAQDRSAVTVNYVDNAIESLRKGEKPAVTFTKAIGCTIKTK
ncbi:MAG: thioredoxin family protein [Bacteroidota bacterium]